VKKTELSKLASEATDAFIDAQKRLLEVVAQQTNVNLKAASRTMAMISPSRLSPMANLTGEGVKSFVSAEKALIESMIKPRKEGKVHEGDRRPAQRRTRAAHAAA
jgi:chemotaxis regulatin CheY-phosphate phosphatase CheZ